MMLISMLEVKGQRKRRIHWGHHIHNNKDDNDDVYLVIVIDIDFFFLFLFFCKTEVFTVLFVTDQRLVQKIGETGFSFFFVKSNVVLLE